MTRKGPHHVKVKTNQSKQKSMMFWIVFDTWEKTKWVHFSACYDNLNFFWLTKISNAHFLVKNAPIFIIFVLFALFLPKYKAQFKTSLFFVCFDWFSVSGNFTYESDFETLRSTYRWWRFLKSLHNKQRSGVIYVHISYFPG